MAKLASCIFAVILFLAMSVSIAHAEAEADADAPVADGPYNNHPLAESPSNIGRNLKTSLHADADADADADAEVAESPYNHIFEPLAPYLHTPLAESPYDIGPSLQTSLAGPITEPSTSTVDATTAEGPYNLYTIVGGSSAPSTEWWTFNEGSELPAFDHLVEAKYHDVDQLGPDLVPVLDCSSWPAWLLSMLRMGKCAPASAPAPATSARKMLRVI